MCVCVCVCVCVFVCVYIYIYINRASRLIQKTDLMASEPLPVVALASPEAVLEAVQVEGVHLTAGDIAYRVLELCVDRPSE